MMIRWMDKEDMSGMDTMTMKNEEIVKSTGVHIRIKTNIYFYF